jgi:iron(II)-dependent oxidoreductase
MASPSTLTPGSEELLSALVGARERTVALVAHLSTEDLERVLDPVLSPLVWDLGHIAAYEDLWLAHRFGGLDLLRPDLAALYDAFETPRAVRGDAEILDHAESGAYLQAVRARVLDIAREQGTGDGTLFELVLRHELQHTETMRQAMRQAGLLPAGEPDLAPLADDGGDVDLVAVPAGMFLMGADPGGFAYDNERPLHAVGLPAFTIARRPVTNATWMTFAEGGGYVRREWWSDEGWAWKEEYDITHDMAVADGPPLAPVCHVSWFEADAFARSLGLRLPTEHEWERAATSTQEHVQDVGRVWEWTASAFTGYPGFAAHPYREYSEVFFGPRYRVLRGGSWASHPRVAQRTFRNWDLPQRRQIFSGLRLAGDPA